MFYGLQDTISTTIVIKTHTRRTVPPINKNSSLGQQIKHYRRLADIKQTDLGLKLGYSRDALNHLENGKMKLVDINLIKGIIKELDIEDKININDDYIAFLLDNPCKKIFNLRQKMNLTRQQFADMLNVSMTSVKRWESGKCHIARKQFDKLKNV